MSRRSGYVATTRVHTRSSDPESQLDAIERALHEKLQPDGMHPAIDFALAAFSSRPLTKNIGTVTDALGWSRKRFIERFKAQVGLSPKRYCRILRFQQAVQYAHRGRALDWAQVALDCGYYDQPHFIHDFRTFSGLTPVGYQALRTSFHNHVKFLQSDEEAALRR